MKILSVFGFGKRKQRIAELLPQKPLVIDVRTPGEYRAGHIPKSVNIPLNIIEARAEMIKKKGKPVLTCCRSGVRSGTAANILMRNGITAINGGAWHSLNRTIIEFDYDKNTNGKKK